MTTENNNPVVLEATEGVVSMQDAKDYLGVDYADAMIERRINTAIRASTLFIQGALGDDYPKEDDRVKEVALMVIGDLFDNRQLSQKESSAFKNLATNMLLQIRLELRRAKEDDHATGS